MKGKDALICDDQHRTPGTQTDNPVAEFVTYPDHKLQISDKLTFQQLSVTECAQICLQVSKEHMFNCSSFEHVTATRDCLLMGFSCRHGKLSLDSSRDFYQLRGSNGTNITCETDTSSSATIKHMSSSSIYSITSLHDGVNSITFNKSTSSALIPQPTTTIRTEPGHPLSSFTANHNYSAFLLPGRSPDTNSLVSTIMANISSSAFTQPFTSISNRSISSSIVAINNSSGKLQIGHLNLTIISPTMVQLSWSLKDMQQLLSQWGFRVVYKAFDNNETNSVIVDNHRTAVNISHLQSDTRYSFWAMSISERGFGVPSKTVNIATPSQGPQGIVINFKVLLVNTIWNAQFVNSSSDAFRNLSFVIAHTVKSVHQGNSTYKSISNLTFSNQRNKTSAFISALYDRSSRMENLYDLYEALHGYKRLQERLPIELLQENFPGKPPTNVTLQSLSLSTVTVQWDLKQANHCEVFQSTGFRVFYTLNDTGQTRSIDVNTSTNHVVIQHLEDFDYYLIWIQRITTRGLGPKSKVEKIRTLEKVVSVNFTLQFSVSWVPTLFNDTSDPFKNVAKEIERNVFLLYEDYILLRRVVFHNIRNDSGKVTAEIEITFGQHVQMSAFNRLYESLHRNGTLGNMTVLVVSDNIPGKPPRNLSVDVIGTTSLLIGWELPLQSYHTPIPTKGLRIYYKFEGNTTSLNVIDTNYTTGYFLLGNLAKFAWYRVWVRSVTSRGLGPETDRFRLRTLEGVVRINATIRLPKEEWNEDLSNTSSEAFVNFLRKLELNVISLYHNDTHLRGIVVRHFRNDSNKVTVETEITFGQHVEMELFITLYQALYRNGSFGNLSVEPVWDNIPGKPPRNLSAYAITTTSLQVRWNTVQDDFDIYLFRIFYVATGQQNESISRTDVNASKTSTDITNLGKFVNYTVWVRSVTKRGLGTASLPMYVRTLEEVVPVNMTVRFNNMTWSINLTDPESENFKDLTIEIQQNVHALYDQESNYVRDVQCHQFRNGSVLADITILYAQNVGPQQFSVIYNALYRDGTLGNLSVQPVNDNIPGKPPKNVSAKSTTSTTIQVTWSCADCHVHNSTIGFLVSYKLDTSNQTVAVAVNRSAGYFLISELKKFANYTIHVSSVTIRGIGEPSGEVSVRTLEDVPSHAPVNLRAYNTSSTSLLVAWEPLPNDHVNGILLGYKVVCKKYGQSDSSKQDTRTTLNFTILTGLEKFTAYKLNVSAFTRMGNGPDATVTAATDQDVPSLPPANITAYNTSSTSLMVTWSPVPQGFTHGIVLGYLVLYKREKDVNGSFINVTSQTTSVELHNLDKFTMHVIKVSASTIKGNGAMSNETYARTHEDVPSLPPTQLTAHNTSSTSLMVTWLSVPDGYVHGILRGYRLLFKVEVETFYQNATTVNQSLELTGLKKFTNYSVKVLAFTRIGDGNVSETITVSTDQDVPSLPPQNVSSYNTSSTSLYVSWHEVPSGFVHGILLGYRVLYKISKASENASIVTTSKTTRYTELQGLKKFTIYKVSVLAFTAIGDGANSTSIFISTDEDIPSQPPANQKAYNTSSTSIRVTWGEVPREFVHGILQGYRVFYKKTGDMNSIYVNETTGPSKRELHVSGLQKFTEYSFKVLAFTSKGDGAVSHNISVLTDEDVPSLPPQSVHSHNMSSTSVNVTWHRVPTGFVHGILRGYRVFYSRTKDAGANEKQATVPANKKHVHLTGLDKFTNYTIQVAAYTRIGDGAKSPALIVSTDEDVPSLPPQNLWANNISSRALRIKWDPVPSGYVHGILRGYKVLYRRANEPFTPYAKITIPPEVRLNEINKLKKFTFYTIRVLAFTIKGEGALSPPVNVTTDEDIPSKQPQNVYAKNKASATEIPLLWKPPPEQFIHGILRGYLIWYSIIELGIYEKSPVFPRDYARKQLPTDANKDILTDLESYAKYSIRIAAFTSKGYGPVKEITTRTCRCRDKIPTNWWNNPPYVTNERHSNSSTDRGIIPTILENIVTHCCGECGEPGNTKIDYTTDANGLKAEKDGVIQVKDTISTKTMISFGIAGVMPQVTYHSPDGDAEYIPIMETPGVAFIVAEKRNIHKDVLMAILSCWPALVIACIMAYLAGVVVWALDMSWNHVDFPKSFFSGSFEGLWWSFVTMTTVGYGDRIPKSIPARLFAFLWTWVGIATIAVLTSSITASLMSMVFQPEKMIYGTKVAAIANSTEYKLGLRRNAKLDSGRSYGNLYEIYEDLENHRVHAALLDSYSTASESQLFSKDWIRVIEIISVRYESANGLVLTGDAMKLARCFRDYVRSETRDIHKVIQRHVGTIKAGDVPFAVKTSSDLLTEDSYLYAQTMIILGAALGAFTLLGLIFHCCFYKRRLSTRSMDLGEGVVVVTSSAPLITRSEAIKQLGDEIVEFYEKFKKKYLALRRKQLKQLNELRNVTNGSSLELIRLQEFSASRRGRYTVTKDGDVNSIFEGMDMTIFDKRSSQRWRL